MHEVCGVNLNCLTSETAGCACPQISVVSFSQLLLLIYIKILFLENIGTYSLGERVVLQDF